MANRCKCAHDLSDRCRSDDRRCGAREGNVRVVYVADSVGWKLIFRKTRISRRQSTARRSMCCASIFVIARARSRWSRSRSGSFHPRLPVRGAVSCVLRGERTSCRRTGLCAERDNQGAARAGQTQPRITPNTRTRSRIRPVFVRAIHALNQRTEPELLLKCDRRDDAIRVVFRVFRVFRGCV